MIPLLLIFLMGSAVPARDSKKEPEEAPRPSSLVERTGTRLVQLDVTLSGPSKALEGLTRKDFVVKVGGHPLEKFEVDRECREAQPGTTEVSAGSVTPEAEPQATLRPTTFLFYFDQPHLTMAGRQQAIDLVRELVPKLVTGGNQGMIVSNGESVETLADVTTDPDKLLAALDALVNDRDQWDLYAQREESRVREVLDMLGIGSTATSIGKQGDYTHAMNLAKQYYREELWHAERDLRRFSMVLARLAATPPPKAVIYLADNMRSNAGEHYLDLFGEFARNEVAEEDMQAERASAGPGLGALTSFDQVVDEASAHGVRLYTVEAEGMKSATQGAPTTVRFRQAQDTLADLALETGGAAFLNGVRASKIAERIEEDLACLYMISFNPAGLPEDKPLRVVVEVDRPKVKAQTRGRIVIQSESAALTSRLLAAFAAPESTRSPVPVRPTIIPTGYENGSFTALVQVAVPGSDLPASTWDLGASVISHGEVREASGRLTVSTADAPVILQHQMSFKPGPFEIVAVAHDVTTDLVTSQHLDGEWPRPNAEPAAVGPIAVLQPASAAIRRDDQTKTSGAVAYAEEEPVWVDRPTALVAVLCKSSDVKGRLRIERQLVGETAVDFPPEETDLGKDGCALIQDLVPRATMTPGAFHYRIRVVDGDQQLASGERRFFAWDGHKPDEPSASAPAGGE